MGMGALRAAPPPRGLTDAAGRQVVVHGLPWAMDEQTLSGLVGDVAPPIFSEVVRMSNGRSKGWGLVAFQTEGEAQAVIDSFNGMEFEGRMLTAKMDRFSAPAGGAPQQGGMGVE